jgi:hypothetical protein
VRAIHETTRELLVVENQSKTFEIIKRQYTI